MFHNTTKKIIFIALALALLATSYAAILFNNKNNNLLKEINEIAIDNEKFTYLLSLERPAPITSKVKEAIATLDDHMYEIRNNQKEQKFTRCMMQAMTGMTGSMGYSIDLNACGDQIENKATLSIFKKLDSLEVAPECESDLIRNQVEFNMCRGANEDYSAKINSMNILFKLITNYTLSEMNSISSNEYN
jgi:hypothetical protein